VLIFVLCNIIKELNIKKEGAQSYTLYYIYCFTIYEGKKFEPSMTRGHTYDLIHYLTAYIKIMEKLYFVMSDVLYGVGPEIRSKNRLIE
jgi:hypothetical protein